MERRLRYSERKALEETGSLGDIQDEPSAALRNALDHLLIGSLPSSGATGRFKVSARSACVLHFGWSEDGDIRLALGTMRNPNFLDLVEILAEAASLKYQGPNGMRRPILEPEERINELFDRHRFGYRLGNGEIRQLSSPALDGAVVGPALLAVKREGWEEVERSYREAIQHQRGGRDENDDALTSANAAVEAALKASGFKGASLGPLAKDFKKSPLVPSELKGIPNALETLLGRSGALRSSYGDSHGKHSGAEPVPDALVALAIHWAGAFIVYLAETSSRSR